MCSAPRGRPGRVAHMGIVGGFLERRRHDPVRRDQGDSRRHGRGRPGRPHHDRPPFGQLQVDAQCHGEHRVHVLPLGHRRVRGSPRRSPAGRDHSRQLHRGWNRHFDGVQLDQHRDLDPGKPSDERREHADPNGFPAKPGGLYTLQGGACSIGSASPYTWTGTPSAGDGSGLTWFFS